MKRLVLTFSAVVGLSTTGVAGGYVSFGIGGYGGGYYGGHYGGYWHGCSFAPGFALGLGLGALCTYPWGAWDCYPTYGYGYYYPAYTYVYPQPASTATKTPATKATAHTDEPQPAPAPETPAWVPSSPGSGAWVPDPEPYSFTPEQPTVAKSSATAQVNQTTSITTSPGGVPVYSNTQTPAR